ncbi:MULTISPECIES: DUF1501 domain-containing protein [unclassified Sphingomonas]|uniref:DUF1501 domain-containing protein n=1 Tax=unclassified Sphingomonas TaxID=196159 RepID=UPI0006F808D6|nr:MULTISPECIES: DUF1501 domain-containing protein [unclassified Sphingomonas]KQX20318.1 hypothetical protein ASD17_10680 [Sphingomonas sp. Root1294]KQY67568.1 hypothetical protein ASD39_10740 [Sphingomonas sp. Root50]KRB90944.1 hypothetical protein ASE22_11745 [Sphingomonas sp. Root720]
MIPRRRFLRFSAIGAGALLVAPQFAFAAPETGRRFLFVIQRGAADGLDTVIPYADPAYAQLRGGLAIDPVSAIKLDELFALHPSLVEIGKMHGAGQALFVHAVASPYRERSHFDAQNVLETGGTAPYRVKDGWLNRLAGLLPAKAEDAIAFAPTVPMALRGPAEVTSYAPSALPQATDDLLARVGDLYAGDAQLDPLWRSAMATRGIAGENGPRQDPASLGKLAAGFLAKSDGPRIAMMETGGWDTHSGQTGRLAAQLKALDTMISSLRDGLGPVWNDTVVLVATEFGRTAAANGTGGTDHGTGAAAMLVGGAVKGGRVVADWPGLAQASLLDGRDLKPTAQLDALIAGAAGETFGIDPQRVARALFADAAPKPMTGLVRA